MFDKVELVIHHGGDFFYNPDYVYKGGAVDTISIDPDLISYPHLLKFLKSGSYGNIHGIYFKKIEDSMQNLHQLFNDESTLNLIDMATCYGKCEIFVEHGLDEVELVEIASLPELVGEEPQTEREENDREDGMDAEDSVLGGEESDNEEEGDDEDTYKKKTVQKQRQQYSGTDSDHTSIEYDSDDPSSLLSDHDSGDGVVKHRRQNSMYASYNPESDPPKIELCMLFENGRQFKSAMIKYAIHEKKDIRFVKNEPERVRLKCAPNCPFRCTASWEKMLRCYQIKVLNETHICNTKFKLRLVSQKWVEETYEDKVLENPCLGAAELKDLIKAQHKINVSLSMVARALRGIQEKTKNAFKDQFRRIRNYAEECLKSIPESTVVIKTERVVPDGPCIFQRVYFCFGAVKKGFLEGCRKMIAVDGCFLKGQLKGEILTAVGRDANNQMYPWAVVEIENNSSWTWFLQLLKDDLKIDRTDLWTIISDQQKGLSNVIDQVLTGIEHRNCARHIHANWSKNHRGLILKRLFWNIAKSTSQEELQRNIQDL
ncbi:unnamed protein product, partial [Cuscuta epithymum]